MAKKKAKKAGENGWQNNNFLKKRGGKGPSPSPPLLGGESTRREKYIQTPENNDIYLKGATLKKTLPHSSTLVSDEVKKE